MDVIRYAAAACQTALPNTRMLAYLRTEAYPIYAQHVYPPVGDAHAACNRLSYELNNRRIDAAQY
jgi:hypothetical protein